MSKVTYRFKNGRMSITNKLTYPEQVNEKVFGELARGRYIGFLPLTKQSKGKSLLLCCEVTESVPLKEYLNGVISKKVFLSIVDRLIGVIKYCAGSTLSTGNLFLTEDSVFIRPSTSELSVIYWPVVNNMLSLPAEGFFRQLIDRLHLAEEDDHLFVSSYIAFFSSSELFSLSDFERLIAGLKGGDKPAARQDISADREPQTHSLGGIEYDPFSQAEKRNEPSGGAVKAQAAETVMCPACGELAESKAPFCPKCGSRLTPGIPRRQPVQQLPALVNIARDRCFIIDSPCFLIGSARSCGCCIPDSGLSEQHAAVLFEHGRYYLKALSPAGAVFLNGKPVPPQEQSPVFLGDSFSIADEIFTFTVTEA